MPCVGEEPITSFFKRVTPGSKRKESTGPVLSAAKRTRPTVEAEAEPSKPKKSQRRQNAKRRIPVESKVHQTESYVSIPRKSSTTPPPVENLFRSGVGPSGADQLIRRSASFSKGEQRTPSLSAAIITPFANDEMPTTRVSHLPTPITGRQSGKPLALHTPPPTEYQKSRRRGSLLQHAVTSIPYTPKSVSRGATRPSSSLQDEKRVSNLISPSSVADDSRLAKPSPIIAPQFIPKEMSMSYSICKPIFSNISEVVRSCNEDPFFISSFSQEPVPSSQTQDNDISEFSLTSPPFGTSSLPDRIGSEVSGGSWNLRSATIPEPPDDCQCIHSSQTQHMLPYHISPRRSWAAGPSRHRTLSLSTLPDESMDEVIQSSQSQIEKELDISKGLSEYLSGTTNSVKTPSGAQLDDERSAASYLKPLEAVSRADLSLRPANLSRMVPMTRTLSDDLFPSSILHLNFDDLFPQESSQNNQDDNDLLSGHRHSHESATEDESEEELGDALRRPVNVNNRGQSPIASHTSSTCADDTMNGEDFVDALQSSLPNTLKDFRDMFNDGDESYPDDFPMSLR